MLLRRHNWTLTKACNDIDGLGGFDYERKRALWPARPPGNRYDDWWTGSVPVVGANTAPATVAGR